MLTLRKGFFLNNLDVYSKYIFLSQLHTVGPNLLSAVYF